MIQGIVQIKNPHAGFSKAYYPHVDEHYSADFVYPPGHRAGHAIISGQASVKTRHRFSHAFRGQAKAQVVVAVVRVDPVTVRRAAVPGVVVPATAPDHPV